MLAMKSQITESEFKLLDIVGSRLETMFGAKEKSLKEKVAQAERSLSDAWQSFWTNPRALELQKAKSRTVDEQQEFDEIYKPIHATMADLRQARNALEDLLADQLYTAQVLAFVLGQQVGYKAGVQATLPLLTAMATDAPAIPEADDWQGVLSSLGLPAGKA